MNYSTARETFQDTRTLPTTNTPAFAALHTIPVRLGLSSHDPSRDIAGFAGQHGYEQLEAHDGPVIALDSMGDRYDVTIVSDKRGTYLRFDREVLMPRTREMNVLLMPGELSVAELRAAIIARVERLALTELEQLAARMGCRP